PGHAEPSRRKLPAAARRCGIRTGCSRMMPLARNSLKCSRVELMLLVLSARAGLGVEAQSDLLDQFTLGDSPAPPFGNALVTVKGPGKLPIYSSRGIRIVAEIDRLQTTFGKRIRLGKSPKGSLQAVCGVTAAANLASRFAQ